MKSHFWTWGRVAVAAVPLLGCSGCYTTSGERAVTVKLAPVEYSDSATGFQKTAGGIETVQVGRFSKR